MSSDAPGPTGDFPHGKLADDDEGGINVALSHFDAPDGTKMVRFEFGAPVAWLAMPREQALAFAMAIIYYVGGPDGNERKDETGGGDRDDRDSAADEKTAD